MHDSDTPAYACTKEKKNAIHLHEGSTRVSMRKEGGIFHSDVKMMRTKGGMDSVVLKTRNKRKIENIPLKLTKNEQEINVYLSNIRNESIDHTNPKTKR